MLLLPHSCKSLTLLKSSFPLNKFLIINKRATTSTFYPTAKTKILLKNNSILVDGSCGSLTITANFSVLRNTHVSFCSNSEIFDEFVTTHLDDEDNRNDGNERVEEVELLNKPFHNPVSNGSNVDVDKEEGVLKPFLKFFKPRDLVKGEISGEKSGLDESNDENKSEECKEEKVVCVEYYDPKPGDFVVAVVVSGNENKLDVNIGADLLGTMLKKEVLPLYDKEMDYLVCDAEKDAKEFMVPGKMGILKNDDAVDGEPVPGRTVVDPGTVLFAEVVGRTLSGRPLLSTRRLFQRLAWHRVRQIKQLNQPIEIKITEWNTGGLLLRIEGLRAFLPKTELVNRVNSFTQLKENVGRKMHVLIIRINEATNELILSEKEAWNMLHLQDGTLLDGTVKKIFPYGAQVRIGESNRSGLLHISNITRAQVDSVNDLLAVEEKVKVLVVKSVFPDKISLSIAHLESEPGLFQSDKERVYAEAEEMAKKYRQKSPTTSAAQRLEPFPADALAYEDEGNLYANWEWFKFERDNESGS